MIYITFERENPKFSNIPDRVLGCSPNAQPYQQLQLRAKWLLCSTRFFAFVSSLKLSRRLLCSVRFVFVSTFKPPTRKSICRWNHQFEQIGCLCKGKSSGRPRVSEENVREFKRVLSVDHANQPVERAENLEYRNQLAGVCWGAVYSSIKSIFFNHPIFWVNSWSRRRL